MIVLWAFLVLVAAMCVAIGFIPNRDLDAYDSLAAGDGVKVDGTMTGTAAVVTSGRRGRTIIRQCASYRYQGHEGEKFFTDRHDCYRDPSAVPQGQSAQLLATTSLEAKFVFSEATRDELVAKGRLMRWIGIGGGVVLVSSIIVLVAMIRRRPGS